MFKRILISSILIVTFFVFSCAEKNETGTVKVLITDAPITGPGSENITEVFLDFKEIKVHVPGGWETVAEFDSGKEIELLALMNGITEEFGTGEVSVGKVNKIRVILGTNNSITVDGSIQELVIPSNKIDVNLNSLNLNVEKELISEVTLDLDMANAVSSGILLKDPAHGNKWTLRPVINLKKIAKNLKS